LQVYSPATDTQSDTVLLGAGELELHARAPSVENAQASLATVAMHVPLFAA
jgi:hypothetical protein